MGFFHKPLIALVVLHGVTEAYSAVEVPADLILAMDEAVVSIMTGGGYEVFCQGEQPGADAALGID